MSIPSNIIHKIALNVSFLISFGIAAFAQNSEQPVAKAGSIDIMPSELKERFELTPWPRRVNQPASKDPQLDFLYTLIAEKLLAQEAQINGMDTSKSFQDAFRTIEKLYVRDALYKHEIESKIKLSQSDVNRAFEKNRYKLKLDYIKADSEGEILKIHDQLKKGKPFLSSKKSADISKDSSIVVSFGELDESLENALYKLKPGQYTQPMQAFGAWYILRLVEKTDQLAIDSKDRDKLLTEARKIAHKRLADKLCNEFYKKFFRSKNIETDGELFWSFSDKITSILKKRMNDPAIAEKERSHLVYDDFLNIESEFGPDSLKLAFIRFDDQPVSLRQFINEFAFDGFYCDKTDPKDIRARLDSRVKGYIEGELLAREAYQSGLQNLPDVKRSLKMWKESYLAQVCKGRIMDSLRVSATNADTGSQILVNIVEILTDNLGTVEKILNDLNNGRDIKELAMKYSKRESTRNTQGEFGYFPISSYGEIGIIASKMKVGEIYGPLKTNEGFSIFKLIDKKEESITNRKSIDADSGKATYDVITQKYLKTLTEHTASLAKRYGVSIDNDQLTSTIALNLNMFAYRYMGFGGKIMAVPLTVPFTEWVKSWQNAEKALP